MTEDGSPPALLPALLTSSMAMGAPRILLVDHDRELAELARGSLEEIGYRVEVAHDGEDALVLCRTMRPDLVVADVVLPRRSGMELAALAKAEDPRLPVILTSGAALDPSEIAARLRQCGADDMLLKPFAMTELRERIATLRAATGDDAPAPVVLWRPSSLADATEGDIAPGVLVPLLLGLRARRHTGVLRLRTGARWKDIVLLDGRPI